MISSFGNRLAADLYEDKNSRETRQLPASLYRLARRKLFYLDEALDLNDLRLPPGNRLEALKGDLKACFSIRFNDQWRIIFRWQKGIASDVSIVDYHR